MKLRTAFLSSASVIAAWLYATPAGAQPESSTPRSAIDRRETMWRFELGYRSTFVTSAGYNAFSNQDYLPQVSMTASRTLFARQHYSFASGVGWDYGSSSAMARGDATSLTMHRLDVPLEGRVHFGRWGYGFLRVAPGVALVSTQIDDLSAPSGSAQSQLTKSRWLFAADASAGYAWLAWSGTPAAEVGPRLWIQADGGYGWVAEERLNLAPTVADDPRVAGIDLGPLAMRGGFFRIAAALSY